MATKPVIVGWKVVTAILSALKVKNSSGTELSVYDSDGYLYQNGTKLTQSATQLNGNGMTMINPANAFTIGTHDYAGAAVDWTLSTAEKLLTYHRPTNANGAVNAIVDIAVQRPYCFINTTGQALTVKGASGTGIVVASTKAAWVMSDGTNIVRLTGDA